MNGSVSAETFEHHAIRDRRDPTSRPDASRPSDCAPSRRPHDRRSAKQVTRASTSSGLRQAVRPGRRLTNGGAQRAVIFERHHLRRRTCLAAVHVAHVELDRRAAVDRFVRLTAEDCRREQRTAGRATRASRRSPCRARSIARSRAKPRSGVGGAVAVRSSPRHSASVPALAARGRSPRAASAPTRPDQQIGGARLHRDRRGRRLPTTARRAPYRRRRRREGQADADRLGHGGPEPEAVGVARVTIRGTAKRDVELIIGKGLTHEHGCGQGRACLKDLRQRRERN